jgi:ATP-dependent helicase/DNAse subunit B
MSTASRKPRKKKTSNTAKSRIVESATKAMPEIPFWKGPYKEGVTNSLLQKYIACSHRFYIKTILGFEEVEDFIPAMQYGNFIHEAEEARIAGNDWEKAIEEYKTKLKSQHPKNQKDIYKWAYLAKKIFPMYIQHWEESLLEEERIPLLEEKVFNYEHKLPSGRVVKLKGKFDGIFKNKESGEIVLQENKAKGEHRIHDAVLDETLKLNSQVMIYAIASQGEEVTEYKGVDGVLYNVLTRPLSQKSCPRLKKTETINEWLDRVVQFVSENKEKNFHRWYEPIRKEDRELFLTRILNPLLEQLCDWWDWVIEDPLNPFREGNKYHYQTPFGIFSWLYQECQGDYYNYIVKNSIQGLKRTSNLFPELEEM